MKNYKKYTKKATAKKSYSSAVNKAKKPRTLTPEQLEKMREGREKAKEKRESEKAAEEKHRSRLDAVAELDAKMKNAAKEERMYEKYAKQALRSRRRGHH